MGNFINKCGRDLIDKKTREKIADVDHHLRQKNFAIMSVLGSGSYGSVYKVRPTTEYAVKIVPRDRVTYGEVELWATLVHPNVHRLLGFEFVEHAKACLFWSEVCPSNLKIEVSRLRKTDDEIPFTQASKWVQDILSGLSYLHGRSLSHLDLKCDNILITSDQTAQVADFGFLTSCEMPLSRYGAPLLYRCPEAHKTKCGYSEVNGKAFDIWTLGTLTFEFFTGNRLFREECRRRLFGSSLECWHTQVYPNLHKCLQCEKFAKLVKKMFPSSLKDIDENLDMLSNFIRSCLTLIPEMRPSIDLLQNHQLFGGSFDKVHLKPDQDIWNNMVSPENISALMGEPAESSESDSPQEKSKTKSQLSEVDKSEAQSQSSEVITEIQNPDPVLEECEFTESELQEMIEKEILTPDVDMKIPGLISKDPNTDAVLYGIYVVEGSLSASDDDDASSVNMESISEENPSHSMESDKFTDTLGHQTRNRPLRNFWKRTKKAFGSVLSACVPTCMKKTNQILMTINKIELTEVEVEKSSDGRRNSVSNG